MSDINQQIEAIEKEIRETPYHKATEHHIGKLRAKLSRLKALEIEKASRKKGGGGGYAVKKQGHATIVLVGPPSAGKSTLINCLTNAKSKVAPYEFTTLTVIPGMMKYHDADLQILDVPGLIAGAEAGRGRGKEVLSVIRGTDLVIFLTDTDRENVFQNLEKALHQNGIRVNSQPPAVRVEKKVSGGIIFHSNLKQDLDLKTIAEIAQELGIKNAEITLKEKLTLERAVDAFSPNRVYLPAIYVVNKSDLTPKRNRKFLYISAEKKKNLEKLKKIIWQKLELVRIYLVRPNEKLNKNHPLIMKKEDTLHQVAQKIGEEFAQEKTKAKIWGTGSKYAGQEVSLNTPVQEGMRVRFL